jgi:hypothetical protein
MYKRFDLEGYNEDEEDRLEDVTLAKSRGKGAPKKKRTAAGRSFHHHEVQLPTDPARRESCQPEEAEMIAEGKRLHILYTILRYPFQLSNAHIEERRLMFPGQQPVSHCAGFLCEHYRQRSHSWGILQLRGSPYNESCDDAHYVCPQRRSRLAFPATEIGHLGSMQINMAPDLHCPHRDQTPLEEALAAIILSQRDGWSNFGFSKTAGQSPTQT